LRGDTLVWLRLASRLGMSLQRCRAETTSSELTLWKVHMEEETYEHTKQDYYLAQIAQEVRKVLSKKPNNIKLKSFLLSYERAKKKKKQMTREEATAAMKSTLYAIAGAPTGEQ